MENSVLLVLGLVAVGIFSFMYLLVFHPEWVGISGKSAQKTLEEHQEGSKTDDSSWS